MSIPHHFLSRRHSFIKTTSSLLCAAFITSVTVLTAVANCDEYNADLYDIHIASFKNDWHTSKKRSKEYFSVEHKTLTHAQKEKEKRKRRATLKRTLHEQIGNTTISLTLHGNLHTSLQYAQYDPLSRFQIIAPEIAKKWADIKTAKTSAVLIDPIPNVFKDQIAPTLNFKTFLSQVFHTQGFYEDEVKDSWIVVNYDEIGARLSGFCTPDLWPDETRQFTSWAFSEPIEQAITKQINENDMTLVFEYEFSFPDQTLIIKLAKALLVTCVQAPKV